MEKDSAKSLLARLGYPFGDLSLLQLSLTHKSYANENPAQGRGDNERLEFLGDAVLDFVVSDLLMARFPHRSEGDLSKIRASLVSEVALAEIAIELGLGPHLLMGRGELKSGGAAKHSILSDALEALLAAVYLDSKEKGGVAGVRKVIQTLFEERIEQAAQPLESKDFKTELQEMVQKRYKDTVTYSIARETGPDHDKLFEAVVSFRKRRLAAGSGHSKKQAEQAAAQNALENLHSGSASLDP